MIKKFLWLFLLLPLLLAGCSQVDNKESQVSPLENKTILFYGDTCPHCKVLEQFLVDSKINERMTIEKREVYNDADNAKLMMDAVNRCALSEDNVGVPFLWTEGKCYMGDDATSFLKVKFNID